MSESGLRSTIGNRVYAKSVSGVRIPISPPVIFRKRLFWALSFSPAPLAADTYLGRVAERLNAAVSKTVLPVLPVTRVQIPPLPPEFKGLLLPGLFSYRQPKPHIWENGTCPYIPNLHGWVVLVGGVWVGLFCLREYTGLNWFRRKGKGRPW